MTTVTNASATIAHWSGARQRGESGAIAVKGVLCTNVYQLRGVPDFSSSRFPDLSQLEEDKRIAKVAEQQRKLLNTLHTLGPDFGFTLRYRAKRDHLGDPKIDVFLIGRCLKPTAEEANHGIDEFRRAVLGATSSEYVWKEAAEPPIELSDVRNIVELLRPEKRTMAWHEPQHCGFRYFYGCEPFGIADHDMVATCRALLTGISNETLYFDCTLTPTQPLTEAERAELLAWSTIAEKWSRDQKVTIPGGLYSEKTTVEIAADPNAAGAKAIYAALEQRLGSPANRLFLCSVKLMCDTASPLDAKAASVISTCLSSGAGFYRLSMDAGHPAFQKSLGAARLAYITPGAYNQHIWDEPDAPETLRRLHRMVDVSEASAFFRLPIPGRDGCPGIPLDAGIVGSRPTVREPDLLIGNIQDQQTSTAELAGIDLNDLSKHCLIVGAPGSGKTTLCFSLLTQLWQKHRIPFMVLEPAKTEYRALGTISGFDEILTFTVGNERVAPFRFNPLEVPTGTPISEHISALNTCFSGAFSLWDPLPMILDESLRDVYTDRGFSEYEVGGESPGLEWPTLADLYAAAIRIATGTSYKGETAGNIKGALETRLGALLRGPKGRCFNTRKSISLDALMTKPVVLELDGLNDDEKALAMMFLSATVRAHAKANRRSGAGLTHVILLEEAHNVIGRGGGGGGEGKANPKEVAVRFFTRMLAEMRALGEGVIIADQLPTAIASEAVKSTNLKIMHRVVAADDREELGKSMLLDAAQMELAAQMSPGQSLVFREGWPRTRTVLEPDFKQQYNVEVPPDDMDLRRTMQSSLEAAGLADVYRPFTGCASSCKTCEPRIREQAERWVDRKQPLIARAISEDPGGVPLAIAFSEYCDGLETSPTDVVKWNCHYQHFLERVKPLTEPPK